MPEHCITALLPALSTDTMFKMASEGIKLVSVNIEGSKHLNLVLDFLKKEQPDVVCMQEVFEADLPILKEGLGMDCEFSASCLYSDDGAPAKPWGTTIFSNIPGKDFGQEYYFGDPASLPLHIRNISATRNKSVLYGTFTKDGKDFKICTTHFTWTQEGVVNEEQKTDLPKMLKILKSFPELILCGDFNAPRGRAIFDELATVFKDNIPPEYTTSIDGNLHRAGHLTYMVDGLFTTPQYVAEGTKLVDGVSDHMAIVSRIRRAA